MRAPFLEGIVFCVGIQKMELGVPFLEGIFFWVGIKMLGGPKSNFIEAHRPTFLTPIGVDVSA